MTGYFHKTQNDYYSEIVMEISRILENCFINLYKKLI